MGLDSLNSKMPSGDTVPSAEGQPVRHRFAFSVTMPGGSEIVRAGSFSAYSAAESVGPAFGGMTVRIYVADDAVPAMAGAVEKNRLPLLASLVLPPSS